MCRRNFPGSARSVSACSMTMRQDKWRKSALRKNGCSSFCFRGGGTPKQQKRRSSMGGVTSNRRVGPGRCKRRRGSFLWLRFAARKRISRPFYLDGNWGVFTPLACRCAGLNAPRLTPVLLGENYPFSFRRGSSVVEQPRKRSGLVGG